MAEDPSSAISRGAFIVIEGLDRSGKSTQAELLRKGIEEDVGSDRVKLIKFPDRTTAIGKMIDSYLRSQSDLDDRAIHLLFSANRWELANTILDNLKAGVTIICDRYAYSGAVYSASKGLSYDWCLSPDFGLPAPDIVVFLDISPEKARERGGYGEERYEREEMQRNVRSLFKKIGTEVGDRWVEIDAGRGVDAVRADIKSVTLKVSEILAPSVESMWSERSFRSIAGENKPVI